MAMLIQVRVSPVATTVEPTRIHTGRKPKNDQPSTRPIIVSGIVVVWHGIPYRRRIPIRIAEPIGIRVIAIAVVVIVHYRRRGIIGRIGH